MYYGVGSFLRFYHSSVTKYIMDRSEDAKEDRKCTFKIFLPETLEIRENYDQKKGNLWPDPGGGGHFHINLYGTCCFSGYHFSA